MATTIKTFLENVMDIANAKPVYTNGGSSKDKCDCIGLIIGGLKLSGVEWSGYHGSNFAARQAVDNLHRITSASGLHAGDLVFKAQAPGENNYSLDRYPRYLSGGKYYNGDLNDYYHVGVVISASPLKIVHVTTPTSREDTDLGKWRYAGTLKIKYVSDAAPSGGGESSGATEYTYATVTAQSGLTVKMRAKPSTDTGKYWDVPIGAEVKVLEKEEGWSKISFQNYVGYMMTKFLAFGDPPKDGGTYVCHIPDLTKAQAEAIRKQYRNAWITECNG